MAHHHQTATLNLISTHLYFNGSYFPTYVPKQLQNNFMANDSPLSTKQQALDVYLYPPPNDAVARCRMNKKKERKRKTLSLKPKPYISFFWFQSLSVVTGKEND